MQVTRLWKPRRPAVIVGPAAVLVLLSLAWAAARTPVGEAPSPETVTSLEGLIRATMRRQGIVGMSVAVRSNGRRWEAGFGLADVENEVRATPLTVYRFASISKPMTAVAVLQCVEKGQIDLDEPIRTYVPQWPRKHPTITPRQLLGHLGGVRWYHGPEEAINTRHFHSMRESLVQFAEDPLECTPGERFVYSSYGYTLLGLAVQGVAGRPFAKHMAEAVFIPTEMDHARDDDIEAIIPNRAAGYRRTPSGRLRNSPLHDNSSRIPGGGLCGTAGDVAAFGAAFLEGRLVRPETVTLMTTTQLTSDGKPTRYGMGWNLGHDRDDDRPEVWHSGNQAQVTALLYLRPDRRTVVAILCNTEGVALMDLGRAIADRLERDTAAP